MSDGAQDSPVAAEDAAERNLLYRGSLASCNYGCGYCPFAKRPSSRAELQQDAREVDRFVAWVAAQRRRLSILFTPWGEALTRAYYRRALVSLAELPHVRRVAIQTNLSAPLDDFSHAQRQTLAFWATFHPREVPLPRFLARCRALDAKGIHYSVGVVGLREHFDAIEELRRALPPSVYLWINAFKRVPDYYEPADLARLQALDPYFHWNLRHHPSAGRPCAAGETTFAVDGGGNVRRCHFIPEIIGNLYDPDVAGCLKPRKCSNATCGCHIGYVHLRELRLGDLYGAGLLERIPERWPEVRQEFTWVSPQR
jgi:hypothetical protein